MPKCSYCGEEYEFPYGLTLVDIVGRIKYFCSSKCRKYSIMNRKRGKWAQSVQKAAEKERIAKRDAKQ